MPFVIPSEGGCQCGEVRYRLIGEPILLAVCHCTDCKHQSGSAFGMSLRMRKADVELLQGAPKQWTTRSDNGNPKILRHLRDAALARTRPARQLERQTRHA